MLFSPYFVVVRVPVVVRETTTHLYYIPHFFFLSVAKNLFSSKKYQLSETKMKNKYFYVGII